MRSRLTTTQSNDRGYILVLAAMLMIPMIGFVVLVVDVGSWYARSSSLARAADAASLAGVVWLPDLAAATTAVETAAERNGFDPADPDITITVTKLGSAELRVTITDNDAPLYFSSLFLDSKTISRSATSEYVKSVPMGNPESYLGTDPERGIAEDNYLSISGAGTGKLGGDRFASKNCDAALCTPGPYGNLPANGGEYREDGYVFSARVAATAGVPLLIEAYDPGYYEARQTCDPHGNFSAGYDFNDLLAGGLAAMFPGDGATDAQRVADWQERYANYPGAIYCSGDTPAAGAGAVTTFIVRAPDLTPFNDLDNTPICTRQFDAYDEDFYALLEQVGSNPTADTFAEGFRRWTEICTVANPVEGDYIIQVKNNAPMGAPMAIDPGVYDGGRNHYSLRARWDDGSSWNGSNLELFANGAMAIDANVPGSTTEMELARVTEAYAGQTLKVEMWDVADASVAGTLTLLPPVEYVAAGGTFNNCGFTNTKPGWSDADPSDCSAVVTNANMNGQLLTAEVRIPPGYDCDEGSTFGCYIRVLVDFPAGTTVYDHTTWVVELSGDPIRLVE